MSQSLLVLRMQLSLVISYYSIGQAATRTMLQSIVLELSHFATVLVLSKTMFTRDQQLLLPSKLAHTQLTN